MKFDIGCQTNTDGKISPHPNDGLELSSDGGIMKLSKRSIRLPIGRTARLAFDIDAIRAACSKAAGDMVRQKSLDELELEECARLDDALAAAQRGLKAAVRGILLSRLERRSRGSGRKEKF